MSDLLKSLWDRLYAWAFPSALALGVWFYFVYPRTTILHQTLDAASGGEKVAIFIALSAAIGFSLYVLSTPLYRILEGYSWPDSARNRGRERQLRLKRDAERRAQDKTIAWKRGLALEELANYPMNDDQVVPTRFGNAIRAFETYGKTRFNLDALTLWYELCAVAPKYLQSEYDSTRASVDFFVATFYLSLAFGITTLGIAAWEGSKFLLVLGLLAFAVMLVAHRLALSAISSWARVVRALVNTGRCELTKTLGLTLPETLSEEKTMWGLVTSYVYFAKSDSGAKLDRYRRQEDADEPSEPPDQDES